MTLIPPSRSIGPDFIGRALVESDAFAVGALEGTTLRFASAAFLALFGLPTDTVVDGIPFEQLVLGSERAAVLASLQAPGATTVGAHFHAVRPNHTTVELRLHGARVGLGGRRLLVVVLTDASEERRERESLSALAFVDTLTGLANRTLFLDRLRDALVETKREHRTLAVFFCDLDGFKGVNDTLGHDAGDAVLRAVAARLRATTRTADTVARLGGDEFGVVLPNAGTDETAALVAGRMLRAVGEPIAVSDTFTQVGLSVGIALFPRDGTDLDELISRADGAMYQSKRAGKNQFTFSRGAAGPAATRRELVSWPADHGLGVERMDAEHRALFARMTTLGELLKGAAEREPLTAAFEALVSEAVSHFASEEALMKERAYPGIAAHAREHARLLDDVRSLAYHVDRSSMMLTMRYLADWLFRHLDTMDRGLARWLRAHEGEGAGESPP